MPTKTTKSAPKTSKATPPAKAAPKGKAKAEAPAKKAPRGK